jgi:mono/diheme cytochrome c family protein
MFAANEGIPRAVAAVVIIAIVLGWSGYLFWNIRQARHEVGSEVELAANRKPYFDDETLEGPRLLRFQFFGLSLLVISAVALMANWINEPGRMTGAQDKWDARFASWGGQLFDVTANGGFNCAGCHGGMKASGGVAAYTFTDSATGQVKSVQWKAPSLDTVLLKFSEDELRFILDYGRPFSPMSAWGLKGGGPMNDQQIETLITYLKSIQLCDPATEGVCEEANAKVSAAYETAVADAVAAGETAPELGEWLFSSDFQSGSYNCARCHTNGWSYGEPRAAGGGGGLGPSLIGGSTTRQFPAAEDMESFINDGSELGKRYGQQGQGSGKMPGFGKILTPEQIAAIVAYERGL